ncbi:cdc42-interacting protein 4 homolog isoform X2 [Watersipora subatra]|uniref:cdc42-interacting protein 4 homolog isoform X2 n=1 Tax=Watersipora subatra TaxID=2589382 RepID=UPI00355B3D9D
MNWGTDLWDQFDKVTDHTLKGIEFCERYAHFVKDRAKVESDYASSLRKLTKNYLPKRKEDSPFTHVQSFHDTLKEVGDVAGQHELLAEQLRASIWDEMNKLASELKAERKKHIEKAKQLENQLASQMRILDNAKRKYVRAYDDQVRAEEAYRNADNNMNLSRAEVDRAKSVAYQKAQFCSDCKAGYAQALEQTNSHQRDYYNKHLPQVFQSLQEMDEGRIMKLQQSVKNMSNEEKRIQPIVNTCLDGISAASEKIDHGEDSRKVIDKFKSGFFPPEDIAFEDLSNEDAQSVGSNSKLSREKSEPIKAAGTTKGGKSKKERSGLGKIFGGARSSTINWGKKTYIGRSKSETLPTRLQNQEPEREDFGHLPPQQQKKQLKEKIKHLKHQITKERAEREGLVKMQDVYRGNPKLGDANSVNSQLDDNKIKMDNLEAEMAKYEGYLATASGSGGTPNMVRRQSIGSHHSTHSADISTPINGNTPNNVSGQTPNSVSGQTPNRSTMVNSVDSFDDEFDDEPSAPIGTATALYPFDATTEGALSMLLDEELSIVDKDNGDGWTKIRKPNGDEGFVPTTYIKIH